ncbi:MAG: sensor histidine kinase [Candidatus Zixiibacteriota bacterium]
MKKTHNSRTAVLDSPVEAGAQDDRMLETFSLFIHDLESPLASIKYLLKLLEENRLDPEREQHRQLVRSSRIALERSESILYDIMAVAKSGEDSLPVSLTNFVVDSIVKEAILLVTGSASEAGVEVAYTNNSGNTSVVADPQLLKRALDNLLYNAVRHTPSGGKVSVYTDCGKTHLSIHIKDSGPGLDGIEPESLFEKYGQVRLRGQGKHRGVGLGLYFCKLASAAMGGTIAADDHEAGGAVFTLMLRKSEE